MLGSDASVTVVKVLEDGWDERCYLSHDGVAKGGEIFGVDGFNYLLDAGSLLRRRVSK